MKGSAKRILATVLCILLIMTFAGACAPKAPGGTGDTGGTDGTGLTGDADSAGDTGPGPREIVTLQVLAMPSNTSGVIEGWYANLLEKDLGIKIDMLPVGDQGEQKLQAYMAAGELPDLIVFKDAKQVQDAQRAGLIVAFDDYKDQLSNLYEYYPTALKYVAENVTTDGKTYILPNNIGEPAVGDELNWGPTIRWDLYKKLGYPEVATFEDLLPLLKAMQDLEPVNEDGQKVYGFGIWSDWDAISMQQAASACAINGIDSDQIITTIPFGAIDYKTNELTSILDPGSAYIRAMQFFFDANQMGLLDPDSLTQRYNTAYDKASAGRYLLGWWPWFCSGFNTPERVNADDFKGFATLQHGEYSALMFNENKVGSNWAWAVSSSGKHIDRCLEYLNYISDPDNLFTIINGPQGVVWDIGSDGLPYVTEEGYEMLKTPDFIMPEGGKLNDGQSLMNSIPMSAHSMSNYGVPFALSKWPNYNPEVTKLTEDWRAHTGYKNPVERAKDKNAYTLVSNAVAYIAPIPDDVQMIVQQIGDIVKTDSWLAVFAKDQAEFDSIVDQMREKANTIGLADVMEFNAQNWAAALKTAEKYS